MWSSVDAKNNEYLFTSSFAFLKMRSLGSHSPYASISSISDHQVPRGHIRNGDLCTDVLF